MRKQIKEEIIIEEYYCDNCDKKQEILFNKIGKKELCRNCFFLLQKTCKHKFDEEIYSNILEPTCSYDNEGHCEEDCLIYTIETTKQCQICHFLVRDWKMDLNFRDLLDNENIMLAVYKEFDIK